MNEIPRKTSDGFNLSSLPKRLPLPYHVPSSPVNAQYPAEFLAVRHKVSLVRPEVMNRNLLGLRNLFG